MVRGLVFLTTCSLLTPHGYRGVCSTKDKENRCHASRRTDEKLMRSEGSRGMFKIGRFGLLVVLLSLSCGSEKPASQAKVIPNQNANQIDMQALFEERLKQIDQSKLPYGIGVEQAVIMESLMDRASPEQLEKEFERLRALPTPASKLSLFDRVMLQVFVERATKKSDRDRLVYLLSAKCPRYVVLDSLELYLADSTIPNPLLILFDSHDKAVNDDSKRALMDILKRVFGFVSEERDDDAKFLAESKDWYLRVGNKLKINVAYHPIPAGRPKELFIVDQQK